MSEVVGVIAARGGSKRLPGKNIRPMAGKPMIAWTIEAALRSATLERLIVSTDDPAIAAVCREWGAEVPFLRPASLAQDTSTSLEVLEHALAWLGREGREPRLVVLLQATSPLRAAADIDGAVALARERDADAVIGVTEIHPHTAHPRFAQRLLAGNRLDAFVPEAMLPADAPAYAINGAVYVNRSESLRRDRSFFPPGRLAYLMPPERSIDVDTALDFFLAEQLLAQNHAMA